MIGYRISEAARSTGFSESALRFYEKKGVVVPQRAPSGYRSYGEADLEALQFVTRGKELGLSLEEITELLGLLEDNECAPVQTRIRHLVTERIHQAQDRIAELVGFTAQLQQALSGLGEHTADGACDDDCGCKTATDRTQPEVETNLVPLAGAPSSSIGCSLNPDLVGERISQWHDALGSATGREAITGGVRVHFGSDLNVGDLAKLAAAEQSCCSFFEFSIRIENDHVSMDVVGPDDAADLIVSVFGSAA